MSSYYDRISRVFPLLDDVERVAVLITVRDEWKERVEEELRVPLIENKEAGDIVPVFRKLSDRVDEVMKGERGVNEVAILLADFHSLAHHLAGLRIKLVDDEGDEVIVFDNPSSPQGEWLKFIDVLAEVRERFIMKGGAS